MDFNDNIKGASIIKPVLEELKELRVQVEELKDLVEDLVEKIAELDLPYNSGFGVREYD